MDRPNILIIMTDQQKATLDRALEAWASATEAVEALGA